MLYNFFVTGTGAAGVAKSIADIIVKRFNVVGEVSMLINHLTTELKILYRSISGDFSWASLGGAILDIGQLVLTFVPAGKITDIVATLWDVSTVL